MHSGVIVAGGRSTRFGDADKAVAPLAGTPMVRRVAERIEPVVEELVVNGRPDQMSALRDAMAGYGLEVLYAEDERVDRGPMAGIRNGLRAADGEYAFVVACDMPFVSPDLAAFLFERATGHDAAIPRTDDGWYQTTQAVYRADAMADACEAALADGERRIVAPIERLDDVVEVSEDEISAVASMDSFENVNTREEFEDAARRIGGGE
ncbi:MAG: molybdenum cofactor guanylyltransferase [Halobacteriales archaeon]